MADKHALLSPSSAVRWLQCPPSARLEAKYPDNAGEAAEEGSLAHKLSEKMLEYHLKRIDKIAFNKVTATIKKHKLYADSMWKYCDDYKVFVLERYEEAKQRSKDAVIFLEQTVDLKEIAPESFGTRDVAIVSQHILDIIDLKYGRGVLVDAEENEQLMLYAAGTLLEFDALYDIHTVRMTIHQPRIDNYSSWEISAEALLEWATKYVMPRAKLAFKGKGELTAGDHCKYCRHAHNCPALAEESLSAAREAFKEPTKLNDKQLADIYKKAPQLKAWLSAIETHMTTQSIEHGKKWPGLKLIAGVARRAIAEKARAIAVLKAKKIRPSLFLSDPELLGITALEKNIGAAKLTKMIGRLIIKPEGKPVLVDKSDNRNEWHAEDSARKAFGIKTKTIKTVKMLKR